MINFLKKICLLSLLKHLSLQIWPTTLLQESYPPHISSSQKKRIIMESVNYSWIMRDLFFTKPNFIIGRRVREDEIYDILRACQDEPCGGHFADKWTTYKILPSGCYWPSLFKDAREYVQKCDSYQRIGWPVQSHEMPLQPQVLIETFKR